MLEPNFSPFPVLETERLLLRKMTTDDAPEILNMRSNEIVMQYIDRKPTSTLEEAVAWINVILDALQNNNGITWAMALKEEPGKLIGTIGLWHLLKEHYRAEVGYMLSPAFWQKGLMKEALLKVISYGFDEMNLHSMQGNINPQNVASAAVLESTGFIREAYFKEDYFFNGKFGDTAIYSRLK